jgi:hypothetical protein
MAKLKDRQRQIPGGFRFEIPEMKYHSSAFSSFTAIVNSVHTLMQANQELAELRGWPTEYNGIENWVDSFNAEICVRNGWVDFYICSSGDTPKPFDPIPFESWPLWAKAMSKFKNHSDSGVGDTVERIIGKDNSEAYKKFYKQAFGNMCGCNGRKLDWNRKYKY